MTANIETLERQQPIDFLAGIQDPALLHQLQATTVAYIISPYETRINDLQDLNDLARPLGMTAGELRTFVVGLREAGLVRSHTNQRGVKMLDLKNALLISAMHFCAVRTDHFAEEALVAPEEAVTVLLEQALERLGEGELSRKLIENASKKTSDSKFPMMEEKDPDFDRVGFLWGSMGYWQTAYEQLRDNGRLTSFAIAPPDLNSDIFDKSGLPQPGVSQTWHDRSAKYINHSKTVNSRRAAMKAAASQEQEVSGTRPGWFMLGGGRNVVVKTETQEPSSPKRVATSRALTEGVPANVSEDRRQPETRGRYADVFMSGSHPVKTAPNGEVPTKPPASGSVATFDPEIIRESTLKARIQARRLAKEQAEDNDS